jgi:hypothetical protein
LDEIRLPMMAAALLWSAGPAHSQALPDGAGKDTVAAVCGLCHDINRIRVGYTSEGWHAVMRMMQNIQVPVPDAEWATVEKYLVEKFPEKFQTWTIPGGGDIVRNMDVTPDGNPVLADSLVNAVGLVDVK